MLGRNYISAPGSYCFVGYRSRFGKKIVGLGCLQKLIKTGCRLLAATKQLLLWFKQSRWDSLFVWLVRSYFSYVFTMVSTLLYLGVANSLG